MKQIRREASSMATNQSCSKSRSAKKEFSGSFHKKKKNKNRVKHSF